MTKYNGFIAATATQRNLVEIASWFSSQGELLNWAGPNRGAVGCSESMARWLQLDLRRSLVLLDSTERVVAFGQCFTQAGRLHLARLAVAPESRGHGLVEMLIDLLIEAGPIEAELGAHEASSLNNGVSLFVYRHNKIAIKAYERYGFVKHSPPEGLENIASECDFMVLE